MSPVARHHHYIPQFFLGGFTETGRADSQLIVIDMARSRCFKTTPRNVAGVRDFNRIEIEGLEPDAFETAMADVEGKIAPALQNIAKTLAFEGEDENAILNLMALLAVRSPQQREMMRESQARLANVTMEFMLRSKEAWNAQTERMRADGYDVSSDVSYEQSKSFYEGKKYDIVVPTEAHLNTEMEMFQTVLPLLAERHWQLVVATAESGLFITTDRPVVLKWKQPGDLPPHYRNNPGYGLVDTLIIFPLFKELALIGDFNGSDGVIKGGEVLVGSVNSTMLRHAQQQVYAPALTCLFSRQDGTTVDGTQILEDLGINGI